MTFQEVKELKTLNDAPYQIKSRSAFKDGFLNVNHKLALKVDQVSSYYDTSSDISVFDPQGVEIGVLCFTKELGKVNWRGVTENQFIAFVNEASFGDREDDYTFKYNYLILKDSSYDDYILKFKNTSSVWGGFNHLSTTPMIGYTKPITEIHISEIKLENNIFKENSQRAVIQPFAHERFLKLYHLLELRFDLEVVNEIKTLDFNLNPEKIGKIFTDYSLNELSRLKHIVERNINEIQPLTDCLNKIIDYQDLANEIFYKFGKNGSPMKELGDFINVVPFGFEEAHLKDHKINYQKNHSKFIKDLASYWIYRVRCSIAHNKIGEYILSWDNEEFIVEFAEPLLKEVLKQCFKK
jgi:hypothetical protein